MEEQDSVLQTTMESTDLHQVKAINTQQNDHGESQTSTGFKFLALPPEIRLMIYRLLLCSSEPISSRKRHVRRPRLRTGILRTCHQVLYESRIILYSENVFTIQVYGKNALSIKFLNTCDFPWRPGKKLGPRLQDMRRFRVEIGLTTNEPLLEDIMRDMFDVLSDIKDLKYLYVELNEEYKNAKDDDLSYLKILDGCKLLRNVGRVVFVGVPSDYQQYLTNIMTGRSPLDHLPKMWNALSLYCAAPLRCKHLFIQSAYDAMRNDDVDAFKQVREQIIELITNHKAFGRTDLTCRALTKKYAEQIARAREHLFDHDAKLS